MTDVSRRNMMSLATAGGVAAGLAALSTVSAQAQAAAAESTLARVRRTGELRASILAGEAPFYIKDVASGTWKGAGIDMLNDIASALNVKLTILEGATGTSIADVQTGKADIAFPFNQSPVRALAVRFTDVIYAQSMTYMSKGGLKAKTWKDLSDPNLRIATVIGGLADQLCKRYSPKAQTTAYKTRDDMILAVQGGKADILVLAHLQALGVQAKYAELSQIVIVDEPQIVLPSCIVIPQDADYSWRDFLNAWIMNAKSSAQIREWILTGFEGIGLDRSKVPSNVQF